MCAAKQFVWQVGVFDAHAPSLPHCFSWHMLARQAWIVKALDAERAALGPAHPFTIRTLQNYAGCLGMRVGWPEAAEMLRDYLGQLKAAGLGESDGKPTDFSNFSERT